MQRSMSAPLPQEPLWSQVLTPSAAQWHRRGRVINAASRVGAFIAPRDHAQEAAANPLAGESESVSFSSQTMSLSLLSPLICQRKVCTTVPL